MKAHIKIFVACSFVLLIGSGIIAMREDDESPRRGRSRSRERSPLRGRSRSRERTPARGPYYGRRPPSLRMQSILQRYGTSDNKEKLIAQLTSDVPKLSSDILEEIAFQIIFGNTYLNLPDRIVVLRAFYDITSDPSLKDILFFCIGTLHYAEETLKYYPTRVFFDAILNPNPPSKNFLIRAIETGNLSLVKFLVEHGITIDNHWNIYNAFNRAEDSLINIANTRGHTHIAHYLADRYNELEQEFVSTATYKVDPVWYTFPKSQTP